MLNYFMLIPINQVYTISMIAIVVGALFLMFVYRYITGAWPYTKLWTIMVLPLTVLLSKVIILSAVSTVINKNLNGMTVDILRDTYTIGSTTQKFDCDQDRSLNSCISNLYEKAQPSLKD